LDGCDWTAICPWLAFMPQPRTWGVSCLLPLARLLGIVGKILEVVVTPY